VNEALLGHTNAAAEATTPQFPSDIFEDLGTFDKSKEENIKEASSVDVEKTSYSIKQEESDIIEGSEATFASPNGSSDASRLRKCLGML
jgi:hypothetical protein